MGNLSKYKWSIIIVVVVMVAQPAFFLYLDLLAPSRLLVEHREPLQMSRLRAQSSPKGTPSRHPPDRSHRPLKKAGGHPKRHQRALGSRRCLRCAEPSAPPEAETELLETQLACARAQGSTSAAVGFTKAAAAALRYILKCMPVADCASGIAVPITGNDLIDDDARARALK